MMDGLPQGVREQFDGLQSYLLKFKKRQYEIKRIVRERYPNISGWEMSQLEDEWGANEKMIGEIESVLVQVASAFYLPPPMIIPKPPDT
jgi:hypothetical protein